MRNKIKIIYPSGSHGKFLEFMLNLLSGIDGDNNSMVYDFSNLNGPKKFIATHFIKNTNDCYVIDIVVDPHSYLKYVAVALNRTSGLDIILEDLNLNTFDKLKKHSIFSNFIESLTQISGASSGNVDIKYLREWARICFFENNSETVTKWLEPTLYPSSDYTIYFESFYNGTILDECFNILNKFNIAPRYSEKIINSHISNFYKNNRYKDIDLDIDSITQSLLKKNNFEFGNTNFIKQAWIDNWLIKNYNISPVLTDEYFTNTNQILTKYEL
jgi:hypothetical protein